MHRQRVSDIARHHGRSDSRKRTQMSYLSEKRGVFWNDIERKMCAFFEIPKQNFQNEHGCRVYLKNMVCFQMTSDESCVHFCKFRVVFSKRTRMSYLSEKRGMFSNDIGRTFLPTFSKRTRSQTRCLFRRLVWKGRSCSAGLPHVLVCELCQKLIHRKFQDRRPRIRATVQNTKLFHWILNRYFDTVASPLQTTPWNAEPAHEIRLADWLGFDSMTILTQLFKWQFWLSDNFDSMRRGSWWCDNFDSPGFFCSFSLSFFCSWTILTQWQFWLSWLSDNPLHTGSRLNMESSLARSILVLRGWNSGGGLDIFLSKATFFKIWIHFFSLVVKQRYGSIF